MCSSINLLYSSNYSDMRIITLLLFLISCSVVSAKTYFVAPPDASPKGNDSNVGTIDAPWATWNRAFDYRYVGAGDTVYFRGGVYPAHRTDGVGILAFNLFGTKSDTICFFAYPPDMAVGNLPILDNSNVILNSGDHYGIRIAGNYIYVKGLVIRNLLGLASDAWKIAVNNSKFEFCTAHHIHGNGFHTDNCTETYLINCDAFHCVDSLNPTTSGAGNNSSGFWDQNSSASRTGSVYYEYCRAWACGDEGFVSSSASYTEWKGCWSFRNGVLSGLGHGFKIGYFYPNVESLPLQRGIYNNVACFNRTTGFTTNDDIDDDNPYDQSMDVFNNTLYQNGYQNSHPSAGLQIFQNDGTQEQMEARVFKNNISYDNEDYELFEDHPATCYYTSSNNSWDMTGLTITDDDFISVDSTGITAPRQADGSLPENNCYNYFLKLASTSDLINKGVDVGLPFLGNAPDLGYSEYLSTSVSPSIPVYLSSIIENATPSRVEMTYSLTLANIVPSASAFTVSVNSSVRTVSSVSVSGNKVSLTLASPVVYGDMVTIAYTKPAMNPLQTSSGSQAASFTAQTVINNSTIPANQPPIINLSSPTKSTSYIAPATITIDAVASDPDGIVSKVEFYQGTVKLGERTSTPYSYTWKEVSAGTYSLTAVATDNKNSTATSVAVSVVVEKSTTAFNQLPAVTIISPGKGKKTKNHDNVIIEAVASDPDGSVSKVEFKSGDVTLAEVTSAPYTYIWEDVDIGIYQITATATDNLGATNTSSILELHVEPDYYGNSEIINLYPNPNNGQFSIDLSSSLPGGNNTITIIDLAGKTVYKGILTEGENTREFNISGSIPGNYIFMIASGNSIIATEKFIKK
jgi:uncharacterized repeat protein (TIGR02059 family)